ncbi:hypothetical protein V2J09_002813 [Rumex salicifolius]
MPPFDNKEAIGEVGEVHGGRQTTKSVIEFGVISGYGFDGRLVDNTYPICFVFEANSKKSLIWTCGDEKFGRMLENSITGSRLENKPLMKRRRGRPRKEDIQSHASKLTPIKPPASMGTQVFILNQTNEPQSCVPPFQPQADLSKGKARVEDANPNGGAIKDDDIIGQAVTGVLDGMFDAGYLLSVVKVGESETSMKGLVFQPGKFVPVTKDNDIAPGAKMYTRIDQGCVNSIVGGSIDSVPFTLQSTHEKIEDLVVNGSAEGKFVDLEADKELDPDVIAPEQIVAEKSSLVPSEAFMECEDFVGKEGGCNIVMEAANGDEENEAIPKKDNEAVVEEKVAMNEHFGSPSLELALSNSSFGDTQVQVDVTKPAVEKNLTPDENQLSIPLQNLESCLGSSCMKDVLKISIDVDNEENTHEQRSEDFGEGNKVTHSPVVAPSIRFLEEIEPGQEDVVLGPLAKKQKIDENVQPSEVVTSESVLQSEGIIAPKEPVDNQGFISNLACLNKSMETD